MTQRRFRLTEKAVPFVRNAMYSFQVAFTTPYTTPSGGTGKIYRGSSRCPVLTLREGGVAGTTNEFTANCLAAMKTPQNTIRNGKRHPKGEIWTEVTGTTTPGDVDLDIDQQIPKE